MSTERKKVFPFHNGTQQVWGDPVTIHRRLTAQLGGNPNAIIEATQAGQPTIGEDGTLQSPTEAALLRASEANERLLAAVRVAFEMPFDRTTGEGATEEECFAALDQFTEWLSQKKTSSPSEPS